MHSAAVLALTLTLVAGLPAPGRAAEAPAVAAPSAAAPAAKVEVFSPQGSARAVRQVSVRFSAAMVALGDPRLADPFEVDCAAPGQGRWADPRNWVYDFAADLPAGLRCRFVPRKGLKTAAGAAVTASASYAFDTGGPSIVGVVPYEHAQIDEEQSFLLRLDAAVTEASLAGHVHCVVEGLGEQIPVELLSPVARAALLSERAANNDYYAGVGRTHDAIAVTVATGVGAAAKAGADLDDPRVVALRCQRRLPAGAQMRLSWGAGIAAPSGLATRAVQRVAYRVRPAFTAVVECTRVNARAGCIPTLPVSLRFSAPVAVAEAAVIRLLGAGGVVLKPTAIGPEQGPQTQQIVFEGPFPDKSTLKVVLPPGLVDDAGRGLQNADRFPLELRIDAYPPLAKFAGAFGILEAREGGVLPVTVRNVEPALTAASLTLPAKSMRLGDDPARVAEWLRRVVKAAESRGQWVEVEKPAAGAAGEVEDPDEQPGSDARHRRVWREETGSESIFKGATVPTTEFSVTTPAGARPAEVVGIPLKAPGFYVVEIESRALGQSLLGRDAPRYVSTAALVTNLAVHFKWGRESSRAWVTRLDTGAPVPSVAVAITDYCTGESRWSGRTDRDGIATIAAPLGAPHAGNYCGPHGQSPLMVSVQDGADFGFTLSTWADGITPYQFGLTVGDVSTTAVEHTVLDRALFRAGETVSMKHFLRRHRLDGIGLPGGLPASHKVTVRHLGSGQSFEIDASFGADGVATSEWKIPGEAKLGDYMILIDAGQGPRMSASFKVEEYRLPTMRASVTGPAKPVVRPKDLSFDLHVAYLAGGSAAGLPVKLRTTIDPTPVSYPGYADFNFGGLPVKEGVVVSRPGAPDEGDETSDAPARVQVLPATLDAMGAARLTLGHLPETTNAAQLTAELEYPDANGELLTATGRVRLVPAALSLGIRSEGWVASRDQVRFRVLALDLEGKPRRAQAVTVSLYQSTHYSYRKRLIGGFYAYESTRETKKLPVSCMGQTNDQGLLLCEVAPGVSGELLVRAETRDAGGFLAGATTSMWVVGQDEWWFGGTAGDRMDLLPERKEYEAGEVARFQVRMPFRSATALVTVEREGVLTSFVRRLEGRTPVVEVPIGAGYAPNVFVSVLAVRGRVPRAEVTPAGGVDREVTALVDMRKPAYRLGTAVIRVGVTPHRLEVRVVPERSTFRVRETAKVAIEVRRADGTALPAGTEVAVAAVDEALLALAPNPSWSLLEAMMGERGLEVWTSTAQTQVVGKRHFGRKAVAHGGGGGRESEQGRELFDSLLSWQPRVRLDADGHATVTVPLNDALSAFRIVAVAHGGTGLFGTGTASINTTQDLILLAGLPPVVREGDRYAATFTVRNSTGRPLSVDLEATVTPALPEPLAHQRVELKGGEARDVLWQVAAPAGARELRWQVSARDAAGGAHDALKATESVVAAVPVRTYQATLTEIDGAYRLPVAPLAGALPGRGGLELALSPTLAGGLDGVREYMQRYPYACLEQSASRAVALHDAVAWAALMQKLPAYLDADGLLRYFPTDRLTGDDALSAYVLAIAQEAGFAIPEEVRLRVLDGLTRFAAAKLDRRSARPTADLSVRRLAAIEALARYGAAQSNMLDSLTIDPAQWPTSAVIDWLGILDRVPGIRGAEEKKRTALGLLRARLNFQGTTMGFSTERGDALWWLMVSGDSNANRMLLAVLTRPEWRADVPRLVRGALGRQQHGHWNTTVANAWGTLAIQKFSALYEATPPSGVTDVGYGSFMRRVAWPQSKDVELSLPWAKAPAELAIVHTGAGRPWATVRATAALPLAKPVTSGFSVARTVTPLEPHPGGELRRGDLVRVRLDLEAQSDMSWVVVEDPIPAGASIQGSGLGGQSGLATREEQRTGGAWPVYEERRFEGLRAYYRSVPKGRWTVEYTVRLNNPGTFQLPPTRVEAMYAPEMYGELPNAPVRVAPMP